MDIFITVTVVIAFTALLSFISYRQRQSSWQGKLIDKQYFEAETDDDSSTPEKYRLTFMTDQGRRVTVDVFEKDYQSFQIGDRAEKKSGDYFPTKI